MVESHRACTSNSWIEDNENVVASFQEAYQGLEACSKVAEDAFVDRDLVVSGSEL